MTEVESSPTDGTNESQSVSPREFWTLVVVALIALVQKGGTIDRWLNRRLGTVSSDATSIEDVGRELAGVTDGLGNPGSAEVPVVDEQTDRASRAAVREAQLRYLNGIRDELRAEDKLDQVKVDRYERYDLLVIRSRLIAGALTLVLAIIGAVLAAVGYLPLGLVSGAIALIPGAGTIGLTKVTELLEKRLDNLRQKQQRNRETLRSVEAMLAIGDDALLDAELSKLARRFAAGSSGGTSDQ
ncbi:MAG TPA: hypothetical protein VKG85_12665 [Actinomycetes bacterium]|nr:hypothetical protein [Actinomycetes bacterium]